LRKRENYRKHFYNWDIERIAEMTDEELDKILLDPGVVRNRLKIYSVRKNAKVALEIIRECGSLDGYFLGFLPSLQGGMPEGQGDFVSEQNPQSSASLHTAPLQRSFQIPIINHPHSLSEVPVETDISRAISKDLKKRGMSFVGSTIIYAWMQAVGMVDDHIDGCISKSV
jgi:DNA-3-methyladenine glycosylase I